MKNKIVVSVAGVVRHSSRGILLLDHRKHDRWTIPVGKAELNEKPKDAIVRELREELGIKVTSLSVGSVFERFYSEAPGTTFYEHVFDINHYDGQPVNMEPHKHRGYVWIHPKNLIDAITTRPDEFNPLTLDVVKSMC